MIEVKTMSDETLAIRILWIFMHNFDDGVGKATKNAFMLFYRAYSFNQLVKFCR